MPGRGKSGSEPACTEMFEKLSEYLDGELADDVCERFDRHIEGCEPCVRFIESLRRAIRLVESDPSIRLPDELRREILDSARDVRNR